MKKNNRRKIVVSGSVSLSAWKSAQPYFTISSPSGPRSAEVEEDVMAVKSL